MRKRKKINSGLPPRWAYIHGAIYYYVPDDKKHLWDNKSTFRLGDNLPEAHKEWARRIEIKKNIRKIKELFERYSIQVIPTKGKSSQKKNIAEIRTLTNVFGEMDIEDLEPHHVYKFMSEKKSKASAQREKNLLSHVFTKAVEWGVIKKHPFKGEIRVAGIKERTRYVEDWEILECLALPSMRKKGSVLAIQAFIRFKLLTGLRMCDILRIKVSDCKEDGICILINKTQKPVIFSWSDELRRSVEMIKSARQVDISPYLFCNKDGLTYVNDDGEAPGFQSMWSRFMDRLLEETKITERFIERDLRAKAASDEETAERAQKLLAHADVKTTKKFYRRKAEIIAPAR